MAKYLDLAGLAHLLEILDNRYLAPQATLKSIELKDVVSAAADNFLAYGNYERISLPNCKSLGDGIFGYSVLSNNNALVSVNLPELETCSSYLLSSCGALTNVDLTKLTSAGESLLSECAKLISVSFGALTECKSDALADCPKLEKIVFNNETVPSTCFFTKTPDTCKLYVPASALEAYKADTNWGTAFKDRIFAVEENTT